MSYRSIITANSYAYDWPFRREFALEASTHLGLVQVTAVGLKV